MLLPEAPNGKKGEPVTLVYQWGHPFENQLFDAPPPARVFVLTPEGKTIELAKSLEKFKKKSAEPKEALAYRFKFTPETRGDFTFILNTPPIWLADSKEFVQDSVKAVVHVQAQKRWDAESGKGFRIMPLTRPYGLLPGMVFQARVLDKEVINPEAPEIPLKAGGLGGLLVQYERYNPTPPKALPSDELVTFATKTDPNGVATCTLPEAGWWCLVAQRDAGKRAYDGKEYPLRQRVILWVHVDEKNTK
jgi:cobalt/nickel transport protein